MQDLARTAESSEPDGSLWLPVNGRTLQPLLRPGDAVRVTPCDVHALKRGDVALVRRASVWMMRLVIDISPLDTAILRGQASAEYGEVHGRVTAMRRRGRVRTYSSWDRRIALLLHRLHATSGSSRILVSRILHRVRTLPHVIATQRVFRPMRAGRIGPVRVRLLTPDDARALELFARAWLPHLHELMQRSLPTRWQNEGFALGAFTESGALAGFIFVDAYTAEGIDVPGVWLRALKTAPWAQRLGIARLLVHTACDTAAARGIETIYADINETNVASLRLFAGLERKFVPAPSEIDRALNEQFHDPDRPRRMVTIVCELTDR